MEPRLKLVDRLYDYDTLASGLGL